MTPRELVAGDVVAGRFRLEERLGGGGMGTVFRATQLPLAREVALKIMLPHIAAQPGASQRFTREARVAGALRHTGSVEIYDFGEADGAMFIAMELLRGPTLRAVLDGELAVDRALDIAAQVADVLVAAHALALVHRDLKPENLFLEAAPGGRERVVVVDFGLAFVADHAELGRLTDQGLVAGTLPYLSPEQARGSAIGPEADIYAFGCLLYEMLSGAPPFDGDGALLLTRHLFVPPSSLRQVVPARNISSALDDLVLGMLAKDPRARPTAVAVRRGLGAIDVETGGAGGPKRARAAEGRAGRMVSEAGTPAAEDAPIPDGAVVSVGVLGDGDPELVTALAANGLVVVPFEAGAVPARLAAIFAPGADLPTLARLVGSGAPVIADAAAGDLGRVRALLRLGVSEVVVVPAIAGAVAQKLWRALRRRPGGRP